MNHLSWPALVTPPAHIHVSPRTTKKPNGSVLVTSPPRIQDSLGKTNKPQGVPPKSGCFGNIMEVPTTGVDCSTAMQDELAYCGVNASHQMAEADFINLDKYKTVILEAASKFCIDPALTAGIISRGGCAGADLTNSWCVDGGAFGLMQIDKSWYGIRGTWNSKEHILQGTEIILDMINRIKKKFPSWSQIQQLKGLNLPATRKGSLETPELDFPASEKTASSQCVSWRVGFLRHLQQQGIRWNCCI
ncbi:lysozyme g-like [Lissotriton helveticus]